MTESLSLEGVPVELQADIQVDTEPVSKHTSGRSPRLAGRVRAFVLAVVLLVAGAGLDRAAFASGAFGPDGSTSGQPAGAAATPAPGSSSQRNLALIDQAWNLLHEKYVGAATLDSSKMAYAAIAGMTDAVGDTGHTSFLTPSQVADAKKELSGSYVGVGALMDTTGDEPVVVGIFRGSPAAAAGLRAGDVVTAVDGSATKGTPLDVVVAKVRGPAGTPVTLTVRRPTSGTTLTFRIVRAEVSIPSVEWAPVPGTSIVDIRIEQFATGAGDAFRKALQAALATRPAGIVLDLRGNPGGYVNEAVDIVSQFVGSGNVYLSRDASGKQVPTPVKPGGLALSVPVVVLVDRGTASAAEIVTGAIQDAGRAQVVGARTFGTGTVLATFQLSDGSALRIGTVEWLTPKGREIWHQGLGPDVVVALPDGVLPVSPDQLRTLDPAGVAASTDVQLKRALQMLGARVG